MSLKFYSAKPKRKARPEAALQRLVVEHLRLRAGDNVLYFSIANEGKRSPAMGAELKRMGLRPGAADLCVIVDGRANFLELKSADGVQSAAQKEFATDARAARCPYYIVYNINEALSELENLGAFPRVRSQAA